MKWFSLFLALFRCSSYTVLMKNKYYIVCSVLTSRDSRPIRRIVEYSNWNSIRMRSVIQLRAMTILTVLFCFAFFDYYYYFINVLFLYTMLNPFILWRYFFEFLLLFQTSCASDFNVNKFQYPVLWARVVCFFFFHYHRTQFCVYVTKNDCKLSAMHGIWTKTTYVKWHKNNNE